MSATILGLGTAVPEHSIRQAQAAEYASTACCFTDEQRNKLPKLYRVTGVDRRYSTLLERPDGEDARQTFFPDAQSENDTGPSLGVRMERYETDAPPLAVRAAREALAEAGCRADAVTHLVTVSCSGFVAPGVDIALIRDLGLRHTVQRAHVGFMGCHGALNGLRVADGFVASNPGAVVLVSAVELCSIHFQYGWELQRNVANALFADGAAAMVVGEGDGQASEAWHAGAFGSCLVPDSLDAMTWRIRDSGFVMTLSPEVPKLIETHVAEWIEQWLNVHETRMEHIRSWAVHPGGPAILKAVEKTLGLDREALAISRDTLRNYGNMSSPTILFILDRFRREQMPRPCVALGFGPGLMVEAVLFT